MRSLPFDRRLIVKRARSLAPVAGFAGRYKVQDLVAAALSDWLDVIAVQDNIRRLRSAVLAGEAIALEDLEPGPLRN